MAKRVEKLRLLVSGRVQCVGFRAFVRSRALEQNLAGHARNLADGRVEVLLCGDADAVMRVKNAVADGPPGARVSGMEETSVADAVAVPGGFTIA